MYQVKIYHHRPYIRRGDLEDETILSASENFKLRKDAKAYIETKLKSLKNVKRGYVKTGTSYCIGFTGKSWTNENTGDEHDESYKFYLTKL